ncbi:MAG: T9SS type A sorting domain-containing protein [Candidatus Kapaibacterium sp.]
MRALIFAGDTIVAGFNHGAGVYLSMDSGLTWHDANQGLTDKDIYAFIVFNSYLFACGGRSSGVWRRPLSNFDPVKRVGAPSEFILTQNIPNPFATRTTFTFALKKPSTVSPIITDVLGKQVRILDSKLMSVGDHSISWNASQFANGVYSYRLEADGISISKKLVALK